MYLSEVYQCLLGLKYHQPLYAELFTEMDLLVSRHGRQVNDVFLYSIITWWLNTPPQAKSNFQVSLCQHIIMVPFEHAPSVPECLPCTHVHAICNAQPHNVQTQLKLTLVLRHRDCHHCISIVGSNKQLFTHSEGSCRYN